MIKLKNLTVIMDDMPILRGVNLDAYKGTSIALKGPSGGGKSTLLKALVGGCRWQAEQYHFQGQHITADNIQYIRQRTGYIGQESTLAGTSIRESLMQPFQFSAYRSRVFPEGEMARLLKAFHLPVELLRRHPSALSGGQQQRISIIRALLLNPELIIADEPTSALDPESRNSVIKELLNRGRTIISTSHDQHWLNNCDRLLTLSGGVIINEESNKEARYA